MAVKDNEQIIKILIKACKVAAKQIAVLTPLSIDGMSPDLSAAINKIAAEADETRELLRCVVSQAENKE